MKHISNFEGFLNEATKNVEEKYTPAQLKKISNVIFKILKEGGDHQIIAGEIATTLKKVYATEHIAKIVKTIGKGWKNLKNAEEEMKETSEKFAKKVLDKLS